MGQYFGFLSLIQVVIYYLGNFIMLLNKIILNSLVYQRREKSIRASHWLWLVVNWYRAPKTSNFEFQI